MGDFLKKAYDDAEKKLICPFCGEPLCQTYSFNPTQFWCSNYHDPKHPINVQGTKELWQELDRTRKALDVAVDALNAITATPLNSRVIHDVGNKALEQITALEQKE